MLNQFKSGAKSFSYTTYSKCLLEMLSSLIYFTACVQNFDHQHAYTEVLWVMHATCHYALTSCSTLWQAFSRHCHRNCNDTTMTSRACRTKELKTASSHLIPQQQHLYNGLARPADYSIFAREWTRPPEGESMLAQEWTCPHGQRAGQRPPSTARDNNRTDNVKT